MKFKILGPLEVHDGDRQLVCRGQKQRLLLATLLLNANRVVSSDSLSDALWGESRPQTPDKALQMHVSTLRRLLEPGTLVTRPPGYELRLMEGQLDLADFDGMVEKARAAAGASRHREAAGMFSQALRLWRGPPLADLSFESSLQDDLARLEEARLAALEDRIEADLGVGRHAELIAELEALTAKHPLRERLRRQLMLALYRSGRQAEALEAYRATRAALVEELGIEPGRELKELENAILAQDPALDLEEDPEAESSLVGRRRELAELRSVLDAALTGRAALILIGGEPGIGKSRLAEALGDHARERGALVAVGRCWEAGGAPAYWPWVQALRSYARSTDPELLRSHLEHGAGEVATLVPELNKSPSERAEHPDVASPSARFRLFEAVASFLRSAAAAQPLVVGLDDLHAADAPSLLLLRFVAGALGDSPIAVVGCYRDTEVSPDLAEALPQLIREPVTHRVVLAGLDPADTARLLELSVGREPHERLVAQVHAETDGNPLFAGELGRLFASAGYPERDELPVPDSVREVIRDRLRRQSAPCKETLTLASAFGREFELETLERLSTLDREQLFAAVEEAIDARLVGEVPGGDGKLRFSHVLIRDVLYEDVPVSRRLELHRAIGELLEAAYSSNIESRLAELAHHYVLSGSSGRVKAVRYAWRAGDRAAAQLGYEEAARHYSSALRIAEAAEVGDAGQTAELLLSLGEVLSRAGDGPAANDAFQRAADIAERSGDADRLARAALGYGGRFIWARAASDPGLVPLLERALAAIGPEDSPARVRLLASLASAIRGDASRERRVALADEGVAMARRIGDPATLAHALAGQGPAVAGPQDVETRMGRIDELLGLAEQIGDRERAHLAHEFRLNTFWTLADRSGVEVELAALEGIAGELRQPAHHWMVTVVSAQLALMEGRLDRADALIAESAELGRRAQSWHAVVSQRMQLFVLRRAQGRLEEIERVMGRSVHEYPDLVRFPCAFVHLQAELGRPRETREGFDRLLSRDLANEHLDEEWLVAMSFLPAPCAFLGDRDAAARLYDILLPFQRHYAQAPVEAVFGSVARGLGVLAATAGRYDDAEAHFEVAVGTERRMGARPWIAHAQHDFAQMLATRGDGERSRGLAREALAGYRELGMDSWADRVAHLS